MVAKKNFTWAIAAAAIILAIVCVFIGLNFFKAAPAPTVEPPKEFTYELLETAQTANQALVVSGSNGSLLFGTTLKSGGGNFETAKLVKKEGIYQVVLSDTDNKLLNTVVSYKISGEINNIPAGSYTLQIVNGNKNSGNKILAEKKFSI